LIEQAHHVTRPADRHGRDRKQIFQDQVPAGVGQRLLYSYATLGRGYRLVIGWNLILEYLFAVATVSVGCRVYVVSLLDQVALAHP